MVIHQRFTPAAFLSVYAVLACTVLTLLGHNEWSALRQMRAQAVEKSEALANLAAEQALRIFEINDIALRSAAERIANRGIGDKQRLKSDWDFLLSLQRDNLASDAPRIQHILILDDRGIVRLHSRKFPAPPLDMSDQEFFTAHRERDAGGLFIATPVAGIGGADLSFPISRRITAPDGSFVGVAAAAISYNISDEFFQSYGVDPHVTLLVIHAGGHIVDAHPMSPGRIGKPVPEVEIASAIGRGDLSGFVITGEFLDGEGRIIGYRRVGKLPLYVAVGIDKADIWSRWMRSALAKIAPTAGVLFGFGLLIWFLLRQYRRQIVAHGLLSATYDAANTGFCVIDAQGTMVRVNKAFAALCGGSTRNLLGQSFTEILAPTDGSRALDLFRAAIDGDTGVPQTLHIRHPNGAPRTVLITLGRFEDAAGHLFLVLAANDITERQRQEERLRESERQLREAQRIAAIGWWTVDLADGTVHWSETLFGIWGFEIPFQPTLESWLASIHPDDRARFDETGLAGGEPVREYRIIRQDGGIRHIHDEFIRDTDEQGRIVRLFGIVQDVTRLRRNERALALSEARLRAILNVAVTGIVVIDDRGRIDMFNSAAEQMFGYSSAEVKTLTIADLMPPHLGSSDLPFPGRYEQPGRNDVMGVAREVIGRTRDGRTFPAYLAVNSFQADGRTMFVGVILDISEQKRREQEIVQAHDRLEQQASDLTNLARKLDQARQDAEQARAAAEAANRAKSEFLAHMSHELRTPLNAIMGFSEMIEGQYFGALGSPRYVEYVRNIHESADHLLSLINDILDLSKIEAGRYDLDDQPVDLARAVEAVSRLVRERVVHKALTLRTAIDPMPPILADERAMKQIIINLLTNALKFTEKGGHIEVIGRRDANGDVLLIVRDTGIGIEEDQIPKVMEAFGQARNAYMAGEPGTGLGLPIVRSLIALHGGSMSLESKARVGTTVTLRLPRSRVLGPAEMVTADAL